MKIGISTASYFNKLNIEDAVLALGEHRVSPCELFLNSFSEYEPEFVEMLHGRVQQAGLQVFSVHPMSTQFEPLLFSLHPRQKADAWKLYELVLRDGKRLGASHYVLHGAANFSGAAKNLQLTRIIPIFRDLLALAQSYGITLTLENVSWCLFRTPDFGARMIDALGGDGLRFTLDIKQAIRSGYSPLDYIAAVGPCIVNLHLCDAMLEPDGKFTLTMPGKGNVDFVAVRDALRSCGYTGPAFIEVYSDMYRDIEEIYESRDAMDRLFNS